MANSLTKLSFYGLIIMGISSLPNLGSSISYCGGPCMTMDDCAGQLICINAKCNDDPAVGTHICSGSSPPPPPRAKTPPPPPPRVRTPPPPPPRSPPPPPPSSCQPYGTLTCSGQSYPKYSCSPAVTSSTPAKLTLNDFSAGGDGGYPSECDEQFHLNTERIVALSTGWYASGSRCLQMIRIYAQNGRNTTARVVDECDSQNGCDAEHAYQPPCKNNIVDGSDAVWKALGLNEDLGIVDITWSMV